MVKQTLLVSTINVFKDISVGNMKIKVNIGSDTRGYWIWNTSLSLLLPVNIMCLEYCVYIIYFIFLLFQFLSFVFNESNITTWMKDEVIESTLSGKIFPLSLSSKLVILFYLLKSFNHSNTISFPLTVV